MKFELVGGAHSGPMSITGKTPGKKYVKGDIVTFDDDLTQLFPNKFKRRKDLEAPGAASIKRETESPADRNQGEDGRAEQDEARNKARKEEKQKPAQDDLVNPLGEDVTVDFPKAKGTLLVFKTEDSKYNVAEVSQPHEKLNEKSLSKVELQKFIKSLT